MKLKKVFMMITAVLLLGTMTIPNVKAETKDYSFDSSRWDACTSDGSCMLVCGWQNDTSGVDHYGVYMYYYPGTKEWKTSWYHPGGPFTEKSDTKIPTKNIFYQNGEVGSVYTNLQSNFQCPSNAYVDTAFGLSAELCLDDNSIYSNGKSYCLSNPGGAGTNFVGTSALKYSLMDNLKIYFDQYAYTAIKNASCEKLFADQNDATQTILDQVKKDLDNFLNSTTGNNLEAKNYIQNSSVYKGYFEVYNKSNKDKLAQCRIQLDEENDKKVANGEMTEEERDKLSDKYDEISERAEKRIDNFQQEIGGMNWEDTPGFTVGSGCGMLGPELQQWLQWVFNIIKIVGPILAIALGMLDFAKAIVSGEDDAMKKASKKFMHRLIAAALLFLIPFILDIVLDFVGLTSSTCGIK